MKSIWTGNISFGLVNIPISLYPAIKQHSLGFKLLHARCHTPLQYKRWCPHCELEVPMADVVKGIPMESGDYFILTPENIKKLKPLKSDSIDIMSFIDLNSLDPLYIDNHYYAMPPAKKASKAYFLFVEALARRNLVAVGQFIMREKQYVCSLMPYKSGLLMNTLNYAYEIRDFPQIQELPHPEIKKPELELADALIDRLYVKKLDMSQFKDTFYQKVQEALRKKGKIAVTKEKPAPPPQPSLIDALKASLSQYEHQPRRRR
jgi:DNA end-binding protein Ku